MNVHRGILYVASCLVPTAEREEWAAEWFGELPHVDHGATAFCLGAFRDAWWMRRNTPSAEARPAFGISSPRRCILLLGALAAICVRLALHLHHSDPNDGYFLVAWAWELALAVVLLAMSTTLRIGEYPTANRPRWWLFLAAKVVLVLPIATGATIAIASVAATGLQPHGMLIGFVGGLRWALADQRRRCPVCLRRLSHPTRIGAAAQTFLAWYGTELICDQGHGLLYVPEIPSSCSSNPRWEALDPSWSSFAS